MIDLVKKQPALGQPSPTRSRAVETGMAMTLLCLLAGFFTGKTGWFYSAATVLVVNMAWPSAFLPVSTVWFGLSAQLGRIMSKLVLTLVFFLVVTPVGLLRRALGKDALCLRGFKSGTSSVFTVRSGTFTPKDLTTPI